jgi:hypothetical protein
MMVVLSPAEMMSLDNVPYHLWTLEYPTPRFLQVVIIQYFSEVMVLQQHVEVVDMILDNAISYLIWSREFNARKFLQVRITQCFSEVMAMRWLLEETIADSATCHFWR